MLRHSYIVMGRCMDGRSAFLACLSTAGRNKIQKQDYKYFHTEK